MTTATYGFTLSILCFLVVATSGFCLIMGYSRGLVVGVLSGVVTLFLMFTVGQSPVLSNLKGEKVLADWAYYNNLPISDDELDVVYRILDKDEKGDLMEKYCKAEVSNFLHTPNVGNIRQIGKCWKGLEKERVNKRYLEN